MNLLCSSFGRVPPRLANAFRPVLCSLMLLLGDGCRPAPPAAAALDSARAERAPLEIADELEGAIASGRATAVDRRRAYEALASSEPGTAESALARAMVAGRLAQQEGLSAPRLIAEVERYARKSAELDPTLRSGGALRLLGTLYVMAPAALLEHGDSERGLELLQSVVERWPEQPENHLRLAEGYLALGDPEPARPHLCFCAERRAELRRDHQRLLDELLEQAEVSGCP